MAVGVEADGKWRRASTTATSATSTGLGLVGQAAHATYERAPPAPACATGGGKRRAMRCEQAATDGARGSSEESAYPRGQLQDAVTGEEEADGIRMDDCFLVNL
jgi:hypothetical protein